MGPLSSVGEVIAPHWTAATCLKLGSPQPIRCCLAMAYLPHWVRGYSRIFSKSWPKNSAPGTRKKAHKKSPALRIASWNVRTMCPGLTADLQKINDARKTAVIGTENCPGWILTLPGFRRPGWPKTAQSEKPTTPSFGKESLWMNQANMMSTLL